MSCCHLITRTLKRRCKDIPNQSGVITNENFHVYIVTNFDTLHKLAREGTENRLDSKNIRQALTCLMFPLKGNFLSIFT